MSHLDDEQLSALVDGEAEADDLTHVEGCADCSARLSSFQAVAAAVTAAPAPPAGQRDRAIRVALNSAPSDERAPVPDGVRPMRRHITARWLPAVAAVAAIVLIGGGLVVALRGGSSSSSKASSGELTAPSQAGGAASRAATGVVDLGPVAGPDALVAALRGQALSTGPAGPVAGFAGPGAGCAAPAAASAGVLATTAPLAEARVVYMGVPSAVFAFATPSGRQAAVAVGAGPACHVMVVVAY